MTTSENRSDIPGNLISIKVRYLDDHNEYFMMNSNSLGSELYQKISIRMQLIESYFFGLQYLSLESNLTWLDLRKAIKKQTDYKNECSYEFCIKFYTPDPNLLHDHLTKKLFVLQIKKDITNGELICSESTKTLLGGLFLQLNYLEAVDLQLEDAERFLKQLFNDQCLSLDFIDQCLKFHKTIKCQTAIETHCDILEIVRKIDFYGMKLHPAKDNEGLSLNLAVYHMGIVIFQKYTKINTFNWCKIRKLSFKRKRFLIKLHPEEYLELFVLWVVQGFYKDTLEFYFDSRDSCKNFWKKCIEHHSFFRTHSSSSITSHLRASLSKTQKFRRNFCGSQFRYIGLTQFELDQLHKDRYQVDNIFQKSESACRLISPNPSFIRLSRKYLENRSNSNHSLSVPVKPSINDSFSVDNSDANISENNDSPKHYHSSWDDKREVESNKIKIILPTDGLEIDNKICSTNQESAFDDNKKRSLKYMPSVTTSDETAPISLIDVPELTSDRDSSDLTGYDGNLNSNFDEYCFVPDLISEMSSQDFVMSGIPTNHNSKIIGKINPLSDKSSSDEFDSENILKCIEKEFLFNEFTFMKELQKLNKIINSYLNIFGGLAPTIREIQHQLIPMEIATTLIIQKLEQIIQINIQLVTKYSEHVDQFLSIIREYNGQVKHNLQCYIRELKSIIFTLMESDFSENCFHGDQLQKDLEIETNLLRLFITPVIQQRAHLSCLSIFILFIPSDEKKLICQKLILEIKEALVTAEGIEESAHITLIANIIKGLYIHTDLECDDIFKPHPIRMGWLQKLTTKGSSNRLFVLLPNQLICAKKISNLSFAVEHRWFLNEIKVETTSSMANARNGYEHLFSPLDSITIMLWDLNANDSQYSTTIIFADTNKSRSMWIDEIRKSASACSVAKISSDSSSQEIIPKINSANFTKYWLEKYRLIEICWHDRVSISKVQMGFLFQFTLSAYLLRKYKLSNEWQRLWVVLTECYLFFYQSHKNQQAITSLCLVGFQVNKPKPQDNISSSWVIKLEKESKKYFLRTENQYFYHRWRTALSYCTFSNS